jgi:hypothetical protein
MEGIANGSSILYEQNPAPRIAQPMATLETLVASA